MQKVDKCVGSWLQAILFTMLGDEIETSTQILPSASHICLLKTSASWGSVWTNKAVKTC